MDDPKKLKKKQIVNVIIGFGGFISLLVFGMWVSDPNRGKPTAIEIGEARAQALSRNYDVSSISSVTAEESWVAQSEKEVAGLKMMNQQLESTIERLTRRLDEMERRKLSQVPTTSQGLPNVPASQNINALRLPPPPVELASNSSVGNQRRFSQPSGSPGTNRKDGREKVEEIVEIDLSDDDKSRKHISNFLPAGSLATVILVSGIDAPTGGAAQSDPMPILMRLVNDGKLPNFFESGIKDCHIVGAGYGDIAAERAYIRLEKLSCVTEDGYVLESGLKGYVTGEDGKAGFRGKVVSKQGSLIAKSLLAGVFSGMGNAISQQYQTVSTSALGSVKTLDPKKVGEAGFATGASTSLEKVADYYLKRANEVYPIIEIASERIGEIIVTNGSDLGVNLTELGGDE